MDPKVRNKALDIPITEDELKLCANLEMKYETIEFFRNLKIDLVSLD